MPSCLCAFVVHKRLLVAAIVLATCLVCPGFAETPSRLTDQEFWKLVSDYSEPDGTFHSENLVSNELLFQRVIPRLTQTAAQGRAYVGVGSEQNFTYIAALRPSIAFIVDIRRGNLDLHLIYKALFEMSTDRAEFVSKLFSRKRPAGLTASSTAAEIFAAYASVASSQALYDQNLKDIKAHLMSRHGLKLTSQDLEGIDFVYGAWFRYGPDIRYELNVGGRRGGGLGGGFPTYANLMTATDDAGKNRSYLASEDAFKFLKDLESRNLLIPVVGNFGGPKALRSVGSYLKTQGAVVSAFYVSNVEQYLREDGIWNNFCSSAATLPTDNSSTFIRSERGGFARQPRTIRGGPSFAANGFDVDLSPMKPELSQCASK
jgi:hypothetical protein